jgi:hypothetical protein
MEYPVGAVLRRPKARGTITHYGIHMGEGKVFELLPDHGERIASFEEFSQGQRVKVHRVLRMPQDELRRRVDASREQKRDYHFFTNNCEHAVNRIRTGRARSVQSFLLLILCLTLACAFLSACG